MLAVIHNERVATGIHFLPFCEQGRWTVKVASGIYNSVSGLKFSRQKIIHGSIVKSAPPNGTGRNRTHVLSTKYEYKRNVKRA